MRVAVNAAQRLAWALPVLLIFTGCKPDATDAPDAGSSSSDSGDASILPIEICQHLARIVAAEAGVRDAQIDPRIMTECEQDLSLEAGIRGTDNWNALAACVLESRDKADLDTCDQFYPMPKPGERASAPGRQRPGTWSL